MAVGRVVSVTLDCTDPEPEARFWAAMVDGTIGYSSDEWIAVEAPGGLYVSAYRVDGYTPPAWPDLDGAKQFHLDVGVDDLDAAEREAIGLGATKADPQPQPDRWRVLLDPAGHPFCLTVMP
jgi:hypothetical protein